MAVATRPHSTISHWNTMIENLEASPKAFYDSVEQAIQERKIPDLAVARVHWKEGGVLSAKREYLEVKRFGHVFHVCGAPFGNGFFVSWWLGEVEGCGGFLVRWAALIPFLGPILFPAGPTYYQVDTALMFQSLTHSSVLEVVDHLTKEKGLRPIPELDRKPVMKDFLSRPLFG